MVHDALTAAEPSLHLTVGVHALRWADLIADVILDAAERDVGLRKGVPLEWLRGDVPAAALAGRLRELLGRVAADVDAEGVRARTARRFAAGRPEPLEGQFRSLDRLPEIGPATRVHRRPGLAGTVLVQ